MVSRYTTGITAERLHEMQALIVEQRRVVATADAEGRAAATRTLATLEDILLLMQRTQGLPAVPGLSAPSAEA